MSRQNNNMIHIISYFVTYEPEILATVKCNFDIEEAQLDWFRDETKAHFKKILKKEVDVNVSYREC